MKKKKVNGPVKEAVYKSRRLWGALLSVVVIAVMIVKPDSYELIGAGAAALAGLLGITSWTVPKK